MGLLTNYLQQRKTPPLLPWMLGYRLFPHGLACGGNHTIRDEVTRCAQFQQAGPHTRNQHPAMCFNQKPGRTLQPISSSCRSRRSGIARDKSRASPLLRRMSRLTHWVRSQIAFHDAIHVVYQQMSHCQLRFPGSKEDVTRAVQCADYRIHY